MSDRDIPFHEDNICDRCGNEGAYDMMGDVLCPACLNPPGREDLTPVTATLHFDLESNEGERRLRECLDAPRFRSVLWDFDQWLRGIVKHGDDEVMAEYMQKARDRLWIVIGECGVSLDE